MHFTLIQCALLLFLPALLQAAAAERPNIVLILADDLGYGSLGCYGNGEVKTPHIDKLAASGIRFTDFHSNGVLCSPTRAALLTGRYPQRCLHVPDEELSPVFREQREANPVQRWAWGISTQECTLPSILKSAGYRTGLVGKWHLGYDHKFHPMNYGFDEFRGFLGGNVDYHTHIAGYGTKELDWWNNRKIENEPGYATDLLTKYATDYILRHHATSFFLLLAHGAPHAPLQGRDLKKGQAPVEIYHEMLRTLDDSVGAVVATLKQQQLESKTLVIFCSDNGPAAPGGFAATGGFRGKKNTLLEGGHRVPCIATWPGTIPAGTTSNAVLMTMDWLPTLASLASAKLPTDRLMDGKNIAPALKGEACENVRDLHWLSGKAWAIRRGPWKLSGNGSKPVSLVNLQDDAAEQQNRLIQEPSRTAELLEAHTAWRKTLRVPAGDTR